MASENAKIDQNYKGAILAVTDDASAETRRLLVDPVTGRLLVSATGATSGEQYADNTIVNAGYKGNLILGTDGSHYQVVSVDSSGNVQVNIVSSAAIAVTNAGITSIDGKITACNTGAVVVASGVITSITNAVAVTGTFWQTTQPVSIAQDIMLGTDFSNVFGAASLISATPAIKVEQQGSVAVTGTFWQVTQPVSIAASVAVTGTFWQKTQPISGTITSITNAVAVTNAGITTIAGAVAGTEMQCDVLTMPTITVNAHAVTNAGTFAVQAAQATAANLNMTEASASAIKTSVEFIDNSVDGNYLNVNCNIAGTDMLGGAGAVATGVQRVTLASDDPAVTALQVIDNMISGNEAQVDVVTLPTLANVTTVGTVTTVSAVTAITNALPAGTNALGKLLPPDIDITTHANYARKYYTSAGTVTDGIIWSPAAGKRWHVVALYINVSAAATVTLEDDKAGGDDPVFKSEFAANSGTMLVFPDTYPMASGEDAADLTVTTSAGNVYCTVVGYEI